MSFKDIDYKQEKHTKYVNDAIDSIYAQQHVPTANDVMNKQMEHILSDIKFEFYALSLDLEHEDQPEYFWTHMDAINSDFQNYFGNWIDIHYYNYVHFCPYSFHKGTEQLPIDNVAVLMDAGCFFIIKRNLTYRKMAESPILSFCLYFLYFPSQLFPISLS